jgi:hypothetical protein
MKPGKSKDTVQGPESCSWGFWDDDCGLSDLARSEFKQIKADDAQTSDRRQEEKRN